MLHLEKKVSSDSDGLRELHLDWHGKPELSLYYFDVFSFWFPKVEHSFCA